MSPVVRLYMAKVAAEAQWVKDMRRRISKNMRDTSDMPKDISWPTNTNRTDPQEPLKDILPDSIWTGRTVSGTGSGPELYNGTQTGRVLP